MGPWLQLGGGLITQVNICRDSEPCLVTLWEGGDLITQINFITPHKLAAIVGSFYSAKEQVLLYVERIGLQY